MKKINLILLLMCVLAMVVVTGCDTGNDGFGCGPITDDGSSDGTLDSSHTGYRNPNCWACHGEDNHNSGLDPADCVECHGNNGARAGHRSNCSSCHRNPTSHPASSFPNDSCTTCH